MKINITKYIFILVVIVLVGIAIYGVYKDKGKEDSNGQELAEEIEEVKISDMRVGIVGFDTLNPILSHNKNIQDLSHLVFDSLLTVDEEYKIQNGLAKEYSLVGEKDYIIKLKENIKWHDGTDLKAEDIKFTIDMIKDSNVNTIYKDNLKHVIGLDIVDDLTVRINLDTFVPFFEYNLVFPIMSSTYYSGEDFINTTKNKNPVGTGVFRISSTESGEVVLKRISEWINISEQELPFLETIHIKTYSNMGECYNAFKTGNIDFVTTSSISWREHLGTIGYNVKEYAGRELDFISFNLQNNMLSRQEVRQAISYAIDKQKINGSVFNNEYIISNSFLDYGNWLYNTQIETITYNIDKARQILIENGWEYKNNTWQKVENYKTIRLKFTLTVNNGNAYRALVAQNIKADLEMLGIPITIKTITDAQYYKAIDDKSYEMILTGRAISFSPDLSSLLGSGNMANYTNQDVLSILNDVSTINNQEVMKEKYKALLDIVNKDCPYIPLYYNKNIFASSYFLSGNMNPNWYNLFYNIKMWYRQK